MYSFTLGIRYLLLFSYNQDLSIWRAVDLSELSACLSLSVCQSEYSLLSLVHNFSFCQRLPVLSDLSVFSLTSLPLLLVYLSPDVFDCASVSSAVELEVHKLLECIPVLDIGGED